MQNDRRQELPTPSFSNQRPTIRGHQQNPHQGQHHHTKSTDTAPAFSQSGTGGLYSREAPQGPNTAYMQQQQSVATANFPQDFSELSKRQNINPNNQTIASNANATTDPASATVTAPQVNIRSHSQETCKPNYQQFQRQSIYSQEKNNRTNLYERCSNKSNRTISIEHKYKDF